MEVDDDILKQETKTDKIEEIEMLQEFERRRKFKAAYDTNLKVEENDDQLENNQRIKKKAKPVQENQDQIENILKPNEELGEIYDHK